MMSRESLLEQAKGTGYKAEILEKVLRLLQILQQLLEVPYLRDRLVLKGGTALNLFYFEPLPRLSVDIDLNYIGQLERSQMLIEKPTINEGIYKILQQNQYEFYRHPNRHAGSKMTWRYNSVLGQKGNLEIDLNYMYRQPIWDIVWKKPKLQLENTFDVPVLDIHELAAGKLSALFGRTASRDLFDAHYLLTKSNLSIQKLRLTFVIYLAMTEIDLNSLNSDSVESNITDFSNRLFPLLRQFELPKGKKESKVWLEKIQEELRDQLQSLFPLTINETQFIDKVRNKGKIEPSLITDNQELIQRIENHPAILWSSKKIRK